MFCYVNESQHAFGYLPATLSVWNHYLLFTDEYAKDSRRSGHPSKVAGQSGCESRSRGLRPELRRLWQRGSGAAGQRGSGAAGRWRGRGRGRGLANSDGADDGAGDPRAGGEPRQMPGVGPRGRAAGLGALGHSGLGTLGLGLCSSRSAAAHRHWRRPAVPAEDQQAAGRGEGLSGAWPEPPGRQGGEGGTGEGPLQPPRKDSLCSTRPKSEHLGRGRPHDSGEGERRPGTAPCVPAVEIRSPAHRLETWSEGLRPGSLRAAPVRQVRDRDPAGGGAQPGPTLGAAHPGRGLRAARARPPPIRAVRHCS
ncbi:uncharacterized protein [Vulpes vulpes]|uniref:Collagen alpha-1(I) chain-like n=1 Tax=Vulpes vulpes TaxID=9627 RepID=A0ABM4Z850_VULVU